jgi:hypothetical protein
MVTVIVGNLLQKTIQAITSTINNVLSLFAVDITVDSSQHLAVHISHFRVQGLMTTDIVSGWIGIV